eukprot:scaffold280767_cov24-Attheya_sp.AAC.1
MVFVTGKSHDLSRSSLKWVNISIFFVIGAALVLMSLHTTCSSSFSSYTNELKHQDLDKIAHNYILTQTSNKAGSDDSSSSTFFPPISYFDVFSTDQAKPIVQHYKDLIHKYKEELQYQWKRNDHFWAEAKDTERCVGRVGKIEATMLYMMIREDKPKHVLEIGTLCGASTRFILEALEKNGAGILSSFDLHDFSLDYMEAKHTNEGRWQFHQTDVFEYLATDKGRKMQSELDL